jgi:hypothetical protein
MRCLPPRNDQAQTFPRAPISNIKEHTVLDTILQGTTFDADQTAREAVAFIEKADRATAQAQ